MKTKLTLLMNKEVIARAKAYAKEHNTSLSQLIEGYLDRLTIPVVADEELPFNLKKIQGMLKGIELDDKAVDQAKYEYLKEKYLHD